jgi:hypothetical protein
MRDGIEQESGNARRPWGQATIDESLYVQHDET